MNVRQFVRGFWQKEIERTNCIDVNVADAVDAVLGDADLTRQAVTLAVEWLRRNTVDRPVRQRLTGIGLRSEGSALVDVMVERATLLETRFGAKKLGDYFPSELHRFAAYQRAVGQTTLVKAAFAMAIATACKDADKPIRAQLSGEMVEAIRMRIVDACPSPEVAEEALATP